MGERVVRGDLEGLCEHVGRVVGAVHAVQDVGQGQEPVVPVVTSTTLHMDFGYSSSAPYHFFACHIYLNTMSSDLCLAGLNLMAFLRQVTASTGSPTILQ